MKKIMSLVISCLIVPVVILAAQTVVPAGWHFAKDHGARTSATLNTVISGIGTREARLILDGGSWAITNNVVFPSNITVMVTENSGMAVSTNVTVGFQGGSLVCEDYAAFSGWGSATGTANFIHRWQDWGDITRFDIGDGITSNYLSWNILTNQSYSMATGTTVNFDNLKCNTFTSLVDAVVNDLTVNSNLTAAGDLTVAGTLKVDGPITLSSSATTTVYNAVAGVPALTTLITNLVKTTATGIPSTTNSFSFFAWRAAAQATTNSFKRIEFDNEAFDYGDAFASHRFTATKAGVYFFYGGMATVASDRPKQVALYLDGAAFAWGSKAGVTAGETMTRMSVVSASVRLTVGKYVELWAKDEATTTAMDVEAAKVYLGGFLVAE